MFDFNGEYSGEKSITSKKHVFNLSTRKGIGQICAEDKIPLNIDSFLDIEILSFISNATEKTQKPFLKRTIKFYQNFLRQNVQSITSKIS